MSTPTNAVYIVDEDSEARDSIETFLSSVGLKVIALSSATEYVSCPKCTSASCLILDAHLDDINELDLRRDREKDLRPPIIFISKYCDITSAVRALRAGAVDFLAKPLNESQLLTAISTALVTHREVLRKHSEIVALKANYASLTPREREVFALVVKGLLNKQAAAELGISEVTLQIHRGNVMRKMKAKAFASLVRMAIRLGISIDDEWESEQYADLLVWSVSNPSKAGIADSQPSVKG
jgi:FixJ family two-component response regulator